MFFVIPINGKYCTLWTVRLELTFGKSFLTSHWVILIRWGSAITVGEFKTDRKETSFAKKATWKARKPSNPICADFYGGNQECFKKRKYHMLPHKGSEYKTWCTRLKTSPTFPLTNQVKIFTEMYFALYKNQGRQFFASRGVCWGKVESKWK